MAIVFFCSFSAISFASDDINVINSTQHSISSSRASRAKVTEESGAVFREGVVRISEIIFWTVAALKLYPVSFSVLRMLADRARDMLVTCESG